MATRPGAVSANTVKINVGGSVFKVAVSTIQSPTPRALLAKMIDGLFLCGKDERGAFFVDHTQFCNTVLDDFKESRWTPLLRPFC